MTSTRRLAAACFLATTLLGSAGATAATQGNWYNAYSLVSDDAAAVKAPLADASLVNGWGLSAGPTTPWWTSNNKTNTSTLYSGSGVKSALTVRVPGGPTGTVFNGNANAFVVSANGKSGSARFLFATQASTRPPRFVIFASGFIEAGYRRFIERRLREQFGFEGTPIEVSVRVREKRRR